MMKQRPRQVLVVLPGPMVARNWLGTNVAARLGQQERLCVTLVTPDASDEAAAVRANLAWRPLLRIGGNTLGTRLRLLAGYVLHQAIVFRFNALSGFLGSELRLRQSWRLRKIAIKDGVPASRWFGRPFPRSQRAYNWLCRVYYARWQRYSAVERLFDEMRPALLVLGHVQTHFATPYALAAAARAVPVVGVVGSWDQPTTKGPVLDGITRFVAQSQAVADDLARYHAVSYARTDVIGWVQMDLYAESEFAPAEQCDAMRHATLGELGLSTGARYVLVGASPERLGHNEPEICSWLAVELAKERDVALVIRCHPNDRKWRERFASQHSPPSVVVVPPELGRIDRMANQIKHAAAVLSPAGSILLDAVGLDTPSIALAFENGDEPYHDRLARRYDMEHLQRVIETGGIALARDYEQLKGRITTALADRAADADKRARLRAEHLDPLDGHAAERLIRVIAEAAGAAGGARHAGARAS